jgi:hypothetical protein
MKSRTALAVAACASLLSFDAAVAQKKATPSPLVNELERCRSIQDAAQRLACFDAASRSLVQATTSGQVAVVDQRQVQQARRSLFGFSMPKIPFLGGDEQMDRLDTTIKSVEALDNGRMRIVIAQDNAVWELTEIPVSFEEPRPGQKVTILRGPLGSYHLRVNGQVGVRGRRVS